MNARPGHADRCPAARRRRPRESGLDHCAARPQVKKLVHGRDLQLTLFDTQDLAEITSSGFPGERLVACMSPFLEAERTRKRESLLATTEADLGKIAAACARARAPLRGKVAARAGHSVQDLLSVDAPCVPGHDQLTNHKIETGLSRSWPIAGPQAPRPRPARPVRHVSVDSHRQRDATDRLGPAHAAPTAL
jgi:hypothetical protein